MTSRSPISSCPTTRATLRRLSGLRVHAVYDGYWYSGRATLEELRQDLRAIQRSLRSDWEAPTG